MDTDDDCQCRVEQCMDIECNFLTTRDAGINHAIVWVQWKTRDRRYQELRRLKVPERSASAANFSPKGPWRLSSSGALHRAFTNKRFKGHGLFSMEAMAGA